MGAVVWPVPKILYRYSIRKLLTRKPSSLSLRKQETVSILWVDFCHKSKGLPLSDLKQLSAFFRKARSPEEGPRGPQNQGAFINAVRPQDGETNLDWKEENWKSLRKTKLWIAGLQSQPRGMPKYETKITCRESWKTESQLQWWRSNLHKKMMLITETI